ncbi:MAG: family 43 glycosylhydrolase [Dysgonomonas sp.]|nr:family 43 glycosylhydrolase [Dysgonomonas sp.]
MKFLKLILVLFVFTLPIYGQKKAEKPVTLADPFIMLHDNVYYAYGTKARDGIEVYTSNDLKTWTKESRLALNKKDSWADRWFWAPEVYYIKEKNKFFMYYSVDEHICVATSDFPLGPFVQEKKEPMMTGEKCIDNSLFIDDDGKAYLYFDRFNDGLNIWVAELENDLQTIKKSTLTKCINVSQAWEEVWPRVNEGAFVTKHKDIYYLTYSGNNYQSPFYGVGYATATSPMGPWTKYEKNPIFQNPEDLVGVGHSAMFKDKKGQLKIVFHAHHDKVNVHPRAMYIADVKFTNESLPVMKIAGKIQRPKLKVEDVYRNPVIAWSMPDPTVIRAEDGYFYLYATEDIRNTPIYKSQDLVDWSYVGTAFTNETRPTFEPKGGLWAPDIEYINGKYVLYYSMSAWGGEWTCGIGAAVADKPEGPFVDKGKLFRSNEIGVQNSIDQFYIEEDGKKYLFWGSFRGIYAIELSDDGLGLKQGAEKRKIAGTAFEGTYIYKRDGYYYLFASIGSCCEGVKSTYQLVVGRSKSLFGPYYDKDGKDMMDNGYTVVIGSNDDFVGNGHCSEIVQDKKGNDWIFYHGVDKKNPKGRVLLLDQVRWNKDGWPYVEGGTPSLVAKKPVF